MTIILYKLDYLNNYIGLKINVLINNINKKKISYSNGENNFNKYET